MSLSPVLVKLMAAHGILDGYHEINGRYQATSDQTARQLLSAMGISASNDDEALRSLQKYEAQKWSRALPWVKVGTKNQVFDISVVVAIDEDIEPIRWQIEQENGEIRTGEINPSELIKLDHSINSNRTLTRYLWSIVFPLELGYHWLTIDRKFRGLDCSPMRLIITPSYSYRPPVFQPDRRLWGLSVQLYSLRSRRNWGMGDFTDLINLISSMAKLGCASIGLNPLHALYPDKPGHISPYSPSSRLFLNPLYIDVESVDDFKECETAQQKVSEWVFQQKLKHSRDLPLIDYEAVSELKFSLFRLLYDSFRNRHLNPDTPRGKEFRQYQQSRNPALRLQCIHETLCATGAIRKPMCEDTESWREWSRQFRDCRNDSVSAFAKLLVKEVEFYQYLQWQAELQLKKAAEHANECGLDLGLYQDLAVGCDGYAADVWAQPCAYIESANIGAPPDDFSPVGQDWGISPINPNYLVETGYQNFIEVLRCNMRYAGALRIDHILALQRLYWIPNKHDLSGAYVCYPMDDLMGILTLESHRNQCLVIGEDLGTVPDELRKGLDERGIFTYKVFYFEKHWNDDHTFKLPHEYPENSLVTAATHDLPPIAGFWTGTDIEQRKALNLFADEDSCNTQIEHRNHDRGRLLWALHQEGLWQDIHITDNTKIPPGLTSSLHQFLARSNAALLMLQVEDVLGVAEQANLPGTTTGHPNWRRKLPMNMEEWMTESDVIDTFKQINQTRKR